MKPLRTLALAGQRCAFSWSSSYCVRHHAARAVRSILHYPGSLSHSQIPQPHRRQEGRLFDLGRYCRNHLHRRPHMGHHGVHYVKSDLSRTQRSMPKHPEALV